MSILITGGSGTLGNEIVRQLYMDDPHQRIIVYSRDEGKQAAMMRTYPEGGADGMRYRLGDVRDYNRLATALQGVHTVVHTAAYKMIDRCEAEAWEAFDVNCVGTKTVAEACINAGVKRALFISTDKAPNSCSTYGDSKKMAEDIWVHSNCYGSTEFVAVRYGNVISSNKSVFHTWEKQALAGQPVTVTDPDATRFYWSIEEAGRFCLRHALAPVQRGCTYIPKMHSYKISDIAKTYSSDITYTGWRCPEKTHETLWTDWENSWVRDQDNRYCLYPMIHPWGDMTTTGAPVSKPITSADALANWEDTYGHKS